MNAAQVRSKARKAVARREEEVEEEEIEGGEINLVPYLDIVTNLLLFILISVASSFIVGEINTTVPNYAPAAAKPTDPTQEPNKERLQLVVSATKTGMIVWSMTGLEGTIQTPKRTIPILGTPTEGGFVRYDYQQLNDTLYEIAARRYKGKKRPMATYEVIIQADAETPYEVVVEIMDYVRRRVPAGKEPGDLPPVVMPIWEENSDPKGKPVVQEEYDPDKHFMFSDILFSLGFQ